MIPIKGYATFHPLKHCWLGSGFKTEWFKDLPIYKNDKIIDPLKKIAEETEEDYQALEKVLKDAGVQTYRSFLDIDKYGSLKNLYRPPVTPRDDFAVIGETMYTTGGGKQKYIDVLNQIDRKSLHIQTIPADIPKVESKLGLNNSIQVSTAQITRVGKDLWWDIPKNMPNNISETLITRWTTEGFRVHTSNRGYHNDGVVCVVKPGCIVSLQEIQNYAEEFPGWDVLYLPDQLWDKASPFLKMKDKVGGQWWLKGEEYNSQLIEFVNTWLNDWIGYCEETVFDVNMLSINENTIICNNYNKEVFDYFKKHKVEPIISTFRHRYFWDSGIHCITQDLYREGTQEDYFG